MKRGSNDVGGMMKAAERARARWRVRWSRGWRM